LFLGDMYAGRFDVGFGDEPASAGAYSVQRKDPAGRDYFSPRMNLAKGEAHNPYGRHYLDLGNGAAIHGSPTAGTGENLGCISLSPRDAEDVFGILSEGSSVTIRR
jgi:lipoprotein-anchoring transpeptidase ErfK/SrfK